MSRPKKLIEVALPLEAINEGSKPETENPFLKNHPRSIHNWWARTPLSVCRAILFAQLVDDPSSRPEMFPTEEQQESKRKRLLDIVSKLATWDALDDEDILKEARAEIRKYSTHGRIPLLLDPFAGRGSIPLEGQRLGLGIEACDLNPVAVLINKALLEFPPQFSGQPPIHPEQEKRLIEKEWRRAEGLAEDIRYYGKWMRDEAERRIGHLYPPYEITAELLARRPDLKAQGYKPGDKLTVIAWLWARTVTCPNPACGAEMPLVRSFWLSKKKGKKAWVEPIIDRSQQPPVVDFEVKVGDGMPQEGTVNRRGAICVACGTPVPFPHVRNEGKQKRMGRKLVAVVAEGKRGRVYLPPTELHVKVSESAQPVWRPKEELQGKVAVNVPLYGMKTFGDLFTDRQLVALTTLSGLVGEARARVEADARAAGLDDEQACNYADAISVYLASAISRLTDYSNNLCSWNPNNENIRDLFQRQAIPMAWDFAEGNPIRGKLSIASTTEWVAGSLEYVPADKNCHVIVRQCDAREELGKDDTKRIISTDPPYYDNIGYADLSDFFYVWLRRSLQGIFPDLFSTVLTPKSSELIASPYRHKGSVEDARVFFQSGFEKVFHSLREIAHPDFPITIYYAFKQEEEKLEGRLSTGWETMLKGLVDSEFQITGTWPVRTTKKARSVARNANALASAIIIVCRPRSENAPATTRREFMRALKRELPAALRELKKGAIAPVDMAQAAIGPGMAIFSRYSQVLEADGTAMSVRTALALINQVLDEYLAEQEGEYDADTRWALAWFEQFGFEPGPFGDAETLSKAKNTSVEGMVQAGILEARGGKVRLLRREELDPDWDPASDRRLTDWEIVQHLIRIVQDQGEEAAARLLVRVGGRGERARDLAYRLYGICERKGWAQEALPYNALVVAWPELGRLAEEIRRSAAPQQQSFQF